MPKFRLVVYIATDRIVSITQDENVFLQTCKNTAHATYEGEIPENLTPTNCYCFVFREKKIFFSPLEDELDDHKKAVKKAILLLVQKKISTFVNTEEEMKEYLEGYNFLNGNVTSTELIKKFSISNNVSYLTAATFFVDKNTSKTTLINALEYFVRLKENQVDACTSKEVLTTLQETVAGELDPYQLEKTTLTPGWLNPKDYRFVKDFEDNYQVIRKEALDLYARGLFINHDISDESDSNRRKVANVWKVFFLIYPNKISDLLLAPFTRSLLNKYPEIVNRPKDQAQIYFSLIPSGGIVRPHIKSTREFNRARHQLCLTMADDATIENTFIRVSGEKRTWQEGKILTLDDGYIHDVQNLSSDSRLILIFDSNLHDFTQSHVIV